ncbi:MAG TPA: hypothetical protein VF274_07725 [Alphaproteobacteria bacterium]
MATARQRKASRENLKKARRVWQSMSPRARARSQPRGRRAKPGSTGRSAYFHIEVRPKSEFKTFRTQDVGKSGGIERVAGKRGSGSWDTQKWLISKEHAHVTPGGRLVADSRDARKVLDMLGAAPKHIGGNRFRARPRPNVPERRKPTRARRRARRSNIRKARATRRTA